VRELKEEYAIRRGCFIRLWPHAVGEHQETLRAALEREGFHRDPEFNPYCTLRLDLSPSLDDLRKNLLQKWRNCLNKAERSGLRVIEGTTDQLYGVFLTLAKEMLDRKRFTPGADYEFYGRVQADLPEEAKMRILVCEADGEPVSVAIYSAIGDTATYLLGATGDKGIGLNGAYLLQWRIISALKARGVRYYDLGGIDPNGNPGVYQFKLGIAGKNGFEASFLGQYEGCFTIGARLSKLGFEAANFLRQWVAKRPPTKSCLPKDDAKS